MADYYLKTDNIMKNMFTVALKDELAAQSQMGKVRPGDKYLAMGRYSDGIDSVILKVMKPNTSRRFFW